MLYNMYKGTYAIYPAEELDSPVKVFEVNPDRTPTTETGKT